jgi:hypothetical protein
VGGRAARVRRRAQGGRGSQADSAAATGDAAAEGSGAGKPRIRLGWNPQLKLLLHGGQGHCQACMHTFIDDEAAQSQDE